MKKTMLTTVLLGFALALGSPAYAGQADVGTSNSATDQYVEMIPDPRGDRVPDSEESVKPPKNSNPSKAELKDLALSGPDGELAASIALATAVVAAGNETSAGASSTKDGGARRNEGSPQGTSSPAMELDAQTSGFGSVVSGVTGTGLGLLLPFMLFLGLVGVVGLLLATKKQDST